MEMVNGRLFGKMKAGRCSTIFVNNIRQFSEDIHGWLKQVGKEREKVT